MNHLNSFPSIQPSTPAIYFQSAAAASYTKKASPIKEGKAITRLSFEDNQDTRLYLAAKVVHHKQSLASIKRCLAKVFQCVELPLDHQTSVLLNINSASKRLHLAKSAIKEAARKGNLLQLLHDATANMSALLAHYQDMKPHCELLSKKLGASAEARKKEVSPALLLRVIDTAFKHYSKNEEGKSFQFTYQGRMFFAHPKESHLELVYLYKQLGVGGYGKVYQMIGLNDGRDSALKQARSDKGIEANEEIKNEYAQLTCIHSQGPVWGIQTKPGKLFQTVSLLNQNQWGYETERYDHSYYQEIKLNCPLARLFSTDCLIEFHQILFALAYMEEHQLLHGHLKPENLLVKQLQGIKLVHIADWGGARDYSEPHSAGPLAVGTYTKPYSLKKDLKRSNQFAKAHYRELFLAVEKKRDVFSAGCILYYGLTGWHPYSFDREGFPIPKDYRDIPENLAPSPLNQLIHSMLHPDFLFRPSGCEAFAALCHYMKADYPAVYQDVQDKMSRYYHQPIADQRAPSSNA